MNIYAYIIIVLSMPVCYFVLAPIAYVTHNIANPVNMNTEYIKACNKGVVLLIIDLAIFYAIVFLFNNASWR